MIKEKISLGNKKIVIFQNLKIKSMKKVLVIMLVALSGLASINAADLKEYEVLYKVNEVSTFKSLKKYLQVSEEQADQLKYVFNLTERKLDYAMNRNSEVAAEKALMFHLGNVKYILTDAQYRKYLVALNVSKNSNEDVYLAEIK